MVGAILAGLLHAEGINVELISSRAVRTERLERVKKLQPKQIVLSAIHSDQSRRMIRMIRAIRQTSPHSMITFVFGACQAKERQRCIRRIRESSHAVYTAMEEAVRNIALAHSTGGTESTPSEK